MTNNDSAKPNSSDAEQAEEPRKLLEGHVAQILNERELVINIGSEHGVRRDMHFKVLAKEPLKIKDPVTEKIIGELEQDKVRVEATRVLERMTVCRTYISWVEGGELLPFRASVANMLGPSRRVYETFNAEKEDYPAPLSHEESYVKIGDRVRQMTPSEENTEIEDA